MSPEPSPLRKIRSIEFHRTKYGQELLVDIVRASEIPTLDIGGDPHVLAFYEIFLLTHGRGTLILDGESYRLGRDRIFFTSPGQPRQWRSRDFDGWCLFFTADFVEEFLRDPHFLFSLPYFHRQSGRLLIALTRAEAKTIETRLKSMQREIRRLRHDSPHALRAALYETLIQLARTYTGKAGAPGPENATAVRLRLLIERDYRERHQPAEYARKLRITVGHLNYLAKRHLGRTAGVLIRERLTIEAKRQLRHTDAAVAEVGYALGFKDPAYFARFFRRATGASPTEFRDGDR